MPEWFWFVFPFVIVAAVCAIALRYHFKEAPTRDDWPHDDSLGG